MSRRQQREDDERLVVVAREREQDRHPANAQNRRHPVLGARDRDQEGHGEQHHQRVEDRAARGEGVLGVARPQGVVGDRLATQGADAHVVAVGDGRLETGQVPDGLRVRGRVSGEVHPGSQAAARHRCEGDEQGHGGQPPEDKPSLCLLEDEASLAQHA